MVRKPSRLVVKATLICDVCFARQHFEAPTGEELERRIDAHGWKRFGPSGQDFCHKCTGASPNTILVVQKLSG